MSVATSTAIAIGVGAAGAGASMYSAKKQSDAAKNAAQIQQTSTNRAQDFNQQAWQAQQQALAPYQQAGAQSLAALMSRYGQSDPGALAQRANGFVSSAQGRQGGQGFPMPQGGPPMSLAMMQNGGPPPMRRPFLDGHALMVGPDGAHAHVPHHNVDEALRRGATHYDDGSDY